MAPSTNANNSTPGPRRYAFSCATCRRKKVRCDGTKPACQQCAKSGVSCVYKSEGDSRLVQQLENANRRIFELEEQLNARQLPSPSGSDDLAAPEEPHQAHGRPATHQFAPATTPATTSQTESVVSPEEETTVTVSNAAEISVDEHGNVQYFGATSRFHVAPGDDLQDKGLGELLRSNDRSLDDREKKWLESSAKLRKSWEGLAFANVEVEGTIDPQLSANLLQIYWTWQHPLHHCVYRPCFVRDMAIGGPYFSEFLLYTIYAHASRHTSIEDPRFRDIGRGEKFLIRAKSLLQQEMEQPSPRIPTIQALLILGGRQCAVGKHSEGWLYTGMAMRMMHDIGLHLHPSKLVGLGQLGPEDLEVRKRLFLSAYVWDKSISICLGRPPTLTEMPHSPESLIDMSDNDDNWTPNFLPDEDLYPATKSLTTDTFVHFCRLAKLINEIYKVIYNRTARSSFLMDAIFELEEKIRHFYSNLPASLRIEQISSMQACPPPHIFSLNVLYHTTLILLYRPIYISSTSGDSNLASRARSICVEETSKVNEFVRAHGRTFNFRTQTYLVSYCVYTAATIDACEIKSKNEEVSSAAAQRLTITLKMLESEARQTPGMKRSIDIIRRQLGTYSHLAPALSLPRAHVGESHIWSPQPSRRERASDIRPLFHTPPDTSSAYSSPPSIFPSMHVHHSHLQDFYSTSSYGMGSPMPQSYDAMGEALPWSDLDVWNASAGFVANALTWNTQEDFDIDVNTAY